jgi:arabinogalactan oligomer/maltooligosaccharide transport system permease protein
VSATTAPPAALPAAAPRAALVPRLLSVFSGTVGLVVKYVLLALSNALSVWAMYVLITRHHWVAVALLAGATLLLDLVYVAQRYTLPAKFLVPGTIFLIGFQVFPIIYTVKIAFTDYGTGHIGTKAAAIKQIEITSLQPPENGKTYTMAVARSSSGTLTLLLSDDGTHKLYAGTTKGIAPLDPGSVTASGGQITAAKGYTILHGLALFNLDQQLQSFVVPVGKAAGIRPQSISTAVELEPTLRYDAKRGVFVRISDGAVFRDAGNGEFAHGSDALEPGWKTGVGTRNFSRIIHDPLIRQPFLRVFLWTFIFAAGTVFLSFAVGLFLAITLDKKGMHFLRTYRSILIIPWAVPGFLSLLSWQGLLDQFGIVNNKLIHPVFGTTVPWLADANVAKLSCILVSAWLTVPFFFIVSLGALQAIPEELTEAAKVDGGGPYQIFRRVTFPLLLVAVGPLLISSFALNFNNFNNIYLLTAGGPPQANSAVAGSTDILISYTYKLAIATGKGQDFALAASVTIIVFFITAILSTIGFARTRVLEEVV